MPGKRGYVRTVRVCAAILRAFVVSEEEENIAWRAALEASLIEPLIFSPGTRVFLSRCLSTDDARSIIFGIFNLPGKNEGE